MYKIQRKQTIEDELIIENAKGDVALTLPVKLHVDDILADYNRLRKLIGEYQYRATQDPMDETALAALGMSITEFFKLIFGQKGGEELFAYYENRYTELLEDVSPFIVEQIQPQVDAAMKQRAERFRKMAKK